MVGRIHEESEPVADFYPGDGLLNKYLWSVDFLGINWYNKSIK
jgi:hypothetical protein